MMLTFDFRTEEDMLAFTVDAAMARHIVSWYGRTDGVYDENTYRRAALPFNPDTAIEVIGHALVHAPVQITVE